MAHDNKDEEDLDFEADETEFKGLRIEQGPSADDDPTIKDLKAKVAAAPKDANLHAQLARAYLELGADDEAGVCFDAALALSPNNPAFLHGKAQVALANSDSHGAEALLEQALALDPNNADILYDLGVAFRQEDNHAKAISFFKQAVAKDPKHARALFVVATYAQNEQKPDEAIEYLKQSIAADPHNTAAYFTAGQLLQARGKADDAKLACEFFSKAVSLDGSDPQNYAKLLQVYDSLGMANEFEKTRQDFKAAFAKGVLNPNFQLVGRYNPSQFEEGDKFVMVFDHFKLLGAEPARLVFIVYKKGEVREDKALYRVSLLVAPDGKLSLHSFDKSSRKHYVDYGAEPPFHAVKADVIKVIQGTLQPTATTPL